MGRFANNCLGAKFVQSIEGAPGEIVTLTISAVDESGNWQNAVWSISDQEDEEERKVTEQRGLTFNLTLVLYILQSEFSVEYFSLKAGPQMYNYTICAQTNKTCVPSEEIKELHFSLVQIIAGSVVSYIQTK